MRIKEFIAEEIKIEKKALADVKKKRKKYPVKVLTVTKARNGSHYFYYRDHAQGRMTYIKVSDENRLRGIAYGRFLKEYEEILTENIKYLEMAEQNVTDYDYDSIKENLPATYCKAIEYLEQKTPAAAVKQSENPKERDKLTITCSNGLKVRSKNEMAICEMLIFYKIVFRYEMALELSKITVRDDGTAFMEKQTIYPDFTIFLPDGTVIYWEHFGMLDKDSYREDFKSRTLLYYDNGIYPPENLIVTMDGPERPFNAMAMRRIIEERILPLM